MREEFSFFTQSGNKIRASIYQQDNSISKPCLILVHGFKGFKDWGFWPYTAEYFSKKGFNVVSFNFSHNGVGDSLTEFDELDKFANNTISLEVHELNEIIDKVKQGKICDLNCTSIGLIGHSRGGAVSIIASSINKNVDALAVWASVSKLDRYTERQKKEWREKSFIEVWNSRTNQMMQINVALLEDIEANKNSSLNIEKAVKSLNTPFLIIHGEQDLTVPVDESKLLYEYAEKNLTELEIIPATGHTFDIVHPFEASNDKFETVLEKTLFFFKKHLNNN
ncbi:Alpha/beta superfamily hydrolase [Ignavibacterium album JCM 16511]|uniref:Alpha/beta superfamily hydrolase n=1 Tax=Ignavibacterium album (strain DSM 19864 / JCM 16511 / NBRC 101810 / Mat9-16) TaxID=945713 RepID=I0AJL7_IGNAJ|nr:alpha/beta fold hydrolase [Ignavibacterium album]AFH49174.1 Alpha/beta superfamily hydrolase [Ignavibacterium album JCM 16511]